MGWVRYTVALLLKITCIHASDPKVSCDIKILGFLHQKENGRWNYSTESDYKFKFNQRNPATRETLQNKGRLKRSKGLFVHRDSESAEEYSDGWLVCNKNRFSSVQGRDSNLILKFISQ